MLTVNGVVTLLCFALAVPLFTLAQQPAVLDTAGNPLKAGTQYYILPNGTTTGGGGATLVTGDPPCPLFVGQANSSSSVGLPVVFSPVDAGETTIIESSDFKIRFEAATICVQSTEWALEFNPPPERTLLVAGGNGYGVFLRIDSDASGYKLVFCPSNLCPTCRIRCGEVGVSVENGERLFALYVPGLHVVFQKVRSYGMAK